MQVKLIDREALVYLVDNLEQFEKDKAIKNGLRAAVNVFRKKGRSNLRARLKYPQKGTRHLMNSFTNRIKRNKLGALSGFRKPDGRHAHLADLGTRMRFTKSGAKRGIMPANSFWSDAKVSEKPKAMEALYQGIEKAVRRINNRG